MAYRGLREFAETRSCDRSELVADALADRITQLPDELRCSLTWDQGKEMAAHTRFSIETGLPVYFCDPRSPWQRGSNENTNGLLRQYFPKRTSLARRVVEQLVDVRLAARVPVDAGAGDGGGEPGVRLLAGAARFRVTEAQGTQGALL